MVQGLMIRWLIRKDMSDVLALESRCFEFPWIEKDFLKCLQQHNCNGMAAVVQDCVLGYMIYELHRDVLRVLNFATDPDYQRRGVGHALFEELTDKLTQQRRNCLRFDCRETNLDAQLFFKSQGCRCVDVLRQLYDDTNEDAYCFEYRIQAALTAEVDWHTVADSGTVVVERTHFGSSKK